MSRLLLSLDTAGTRCAVAVSELGDGTLIARADPDIGRGHAEVLMGLVAEMLAEAGATYADLGRIAVVVGPGSFTGLRVGVAAAKGLALALAIPVVGIASLEALAEPHWDGGAPVLAVTDAKRGEVYAALYGPGGAVLQAPAALPPAGLEGFVAAAGEGALILVGSGTSLAAETLHRPLRIVDASGISDIAAVARIGRARTATGPVRPLYLRGADAKPAAATGILHADAPAILP
jgi:tRNA threonylcarbamoyladenosine biosynthesis protein TsaB